ncbi:hypothetical protein L4D13_13805 [Photobacterium profundum]|uniref:hypothetical protein n=1 Tax=Photobacterium profundum TaxID=74109 RepID=UPI003D0D40ED
MKVARRIAKPILGDVASKVQIETSISPHNFKAESSYTVDGSPVLKLEYKSKLANQLSAYTLIRKDLKFCRKNLILAMQLCGGDFNTKDSTYIRDEHDDNADMLQALTISFIITYAKCFTEARGRKVKLEAKDIFRSNPNLYSYHDFLMKLRNNDIAHSGNDSNEAGDAHILLHQDESLGVTPQLVTRSNHVYSGDLKFYKLSFEVVAFLEEHLLKVSQKIFTKVKKELASVSDEYLYELARDNQPLIL